VKAVREMKADAAAAARPGGRAAAAAATAPRASWLCGVCGE